MCVEGDRITKGLSSKAKGITKMKVLFFGGPQKKFCFLRASRRQKGVTSLPRMAWPGAKGMRPHCRQWLAHPWLGILASLATQMILGSCALLFTICLNCGHRWTTLRAIIGERPWRGTIFQFVGSVKTLGYIFNWIQNWIQQNEYHPSVLEVLYVGTICRVDVWKCINVFSSLGPFCWMIICQNHKMSDRKM